LTHNSLFYILNFPQSEFLLIGNWRRWPTPLISPFGKAVVGGSSIAMGSQTNMGRIAHEPYEGEIKKISIGPTSDLFARRAINVLGILMGRVLRASTRGIKAYPLVLKEVANKGIEVEIYRIPPSRRSKRTPSKARRPTPWSIP
jgi:L-serine dehydratase